MKQTITGLLPGGYLDPQGVVQQDVQVMPLRGCEEEYLAENLPPGGARISPALITTLLSRCVLSIGDISPVPEKLLRALVIADRQYLLLKLREATFGDRVRANICCPWSECGKRIALNFLLGDIPITPARQTQSLYQVELSPQAAVGAADGRVHRQVVFRLPNGEDEETLARVAPTDESHAFGTLLSRCIVQIGAHQQPEPAVIAQLSAQARVEITQAMAAVAPEIELTMEVVCHECGRGFVIPFDLAAFFFGEARANCDLLYREVHFLAYHYHWSEREIMQMPSAKRRNYLEILVDELEQINGEPFPVARGLAHEAFYTSLEHFGIEAANAVADAQPVVQAQPTPAPANNQAVLPASQHATEREHFARSAPLATSTAAPAPGEQSSQDGGERQEAANASHDAATSLQAVAGEEAVQAATPLRSLPAQVQPASLEIPGVTPRGQSSYAQEQAAVSREESMSSIAAARPDQAASERGTQTGEALAANWRGAAAQTTKVELPPESSPVAPSAIRTHQLRPVAADHDDPGGTAESAIPKPPSAQLQVQSNAIPGVRVAENLKARSAASTRLDPHARLALTTQADPRAAGKLEELRHAVRELTAKTPPLPGSDDNSTVQPPPELPPESKQTVIVNRAPAPVRTPRAFWERSYLKRFQLRLVR